MAQTRPTYQTEPREEIEERLRIISGLLLTACVKAEDEGCGCATCVWLRDLGRVVDPTAVFDGVMPEEGDQP